jgi:hypothetical protein
MVGDVRPTFQLLAMIHSDSNKPCAACLQRETPLNSFDAVSTHKSIGSIPLYFIDDSMNDSQLLSVCGSLSSTL